MSLTVKRPTIEGMPSPAARSAGAQDGATAPAMRLDVMRSLRKRPKLAAGVGGAVFLLVFLFGLLRKPAYRAESLIYIEPLASKVLSDGTAGSYDAGRYDSYFQQQMQTALRPDILAAAIEKLPPFVWQRGGESMQSAVTRLQNSVKVERVLTSYQLSISLTYASPQAAAAVVNAVTSAYLEQGRKDEHAVIDQRLQLLGEERQRIQQQLGEDRVEQASLGGMLGLADSSGKTASPFDAQIAGAQTQVAGAREARDVAAAQYAAVQGVGSSALTAAAEEQIATDAGLNSMKQTISQRKALLSTQMAGLTPSNPIYKQDQDEIADLDRSLDAMTLQIREKAERRLQDKLRADLRRTADIEGRLNAELRHQTATATSSLPKLQRAQDLSADITRLTARFTVVDDAMRSLELESNGPGSAHLSVAAQVPASPEPSKRKLILAFSLPLGLFAGLFAAVLGHRLDPRIYSAPDVEQVLGFSPIGVLPAVSEVSGRTMEEYTLRLAAGLQSAYRTSSAQSFVFTAASSAMQTTGFVQAIARILGTLGFKALVMDASSVLHTANRTQAAGARGVSSYRSSSLVKTIEGTRQGFAAEELERLKLKYDLLLIDAPPLLTSAETEYLVRCADATILIAESGVTVKTELYQSALLLQHLNVAGVGAVLQELHLKDAEPAFRAAIEAVERLQRGRMDGLEQAERSEPREHETVAAFEQEARHVSALDRMEHAAEKEAVTLPAVVEPEVEAAAVEPEPERLIPEAAAAPEPVHGVRQDLVAEEPNQVRTWKEFWKRTPEPVVEPEPEPVASPVISKMLETRRAEEPEPVIYFEDRQRPRRITEAVAEPLAPAEQETHEQETIHVDRAPMYREPVQRVLEPVDAVREVEAAPAAALEPEPVAKPGVIEDEEVEPVVAERVASPAARMEVEGETVVAHAPEAEAPVVAEALDHTMLSGAEGHEHLAAKPEAEESAAAPVAEAPDGVVAQPESLIEAYVEKVEELPESTGEAREVEDAPHAPEPVVKAAAAAAPMMRREPASPKMGWFTLKFRGTTERVLRVIPGEEGDEYEPAKEPVVAEAAPGPAAEAVTHAVAAEAEPAVEPSHELAMAAAEEHEAAHGDDVLVTEQPEHSQRHVENETYEAAESAVPEVEHDAPLNAEEELVHAEEEGHEAAVFHDAVATVEQHEVVAEGDADSVTHAVHMEEMESPQAVEETWTYTAGEAHSHPAQLVEESSVEESAEDEKAELVDAHVLEEAEPVSSRQHEVEPEPRQKPVAAEPVAEEPVAEDVQEAVKEDVPEPVPEVHTPVKLRWTVRDLHHDELERESNEEQVATETAVPGAEVLAPATLMSELRSRAAAMPVRDDSGVQKHPSGRRSGAPVEERLEPRPASLTRRWEMLSRFDAPANAEPEAETPATGS